MPGESAALNAASALPLCAAVRCSLSVPRFVFRILKPGRHQLVDRTGASARPGTREVAPTEPGLLDPGEEL